MRVQRLLQDNAPMSAYRWDFLRKSHPNLPALLFKYSYLARLPRGHVEPLEFTTNVSDIRSMGWGQRLGILVTIGDVPLWLVQKAHLKTNPWHILFNTKHATQAEARSESHNTWTTVQNKQCYVWNCGKVKDKETSPFWVKTKFEEIIKPMRKH